MTACLLVLLLEENEYHSNVLTGSYLKRDIGEKKPIDFSYQSILIIAMINVKSLFISSLVAYFLLQHELLKNILENL